jgi:hypothetical protein
LLVQLVSVESASQKAAGKLVACPSRPDGPLGPNRIHDQGRLLRVLNRFRERFPNRFIPPAGSKTKAAVGAGAGADFEQQPAHPGGVYRVLVQCSPITSQTEGVQAMSLHAGIVGIAVACLVGGVLLMVAYGHTAMSTAMAFVIISALANSLRQLEARMKTLEERLAKSEQFPAPAP